MKHARWPDSRAVSATRCVLRLRKSGLLTPERMPDQPRLTCAFLTGDHALARDGIRAMLAVASAFRALRTPPGRAVALAR
jgi:hypothetical protein